MVEKRNVLFVDDDEIVLRSIERAFLDENGLFNQLFAKSGQEALEILQREEVHVIVTDMLMPSMASEKNIPTSPV
jgi:CheY-like chemotaxis protein